MTWVQPQCWHAFLPSLLLNPTSFLRLLTHRAREKNGTFIFLVLSRARKAHRCFRGKVDYVVAWEEKKKRVRYNRCCSVLGSAGYLQLADAADRERRKETRKSNTQLLYLAVGFQKKKTIDVEIKHEWRRDHSRRKLLAPENWLQWLCQLTTDFHVYDSLGSVVMIDVRIIDARNHLVFSWNFK